MGNESSQPFSDGEDGPQYRYHETVLRDAHRRLEAATPVPHLPQLGRTGLDYLSDEDEQFYSAEEGDSSRSVTPERTRPESSSGEEHASDNDDDDNNEQTLAQRANTILLPSTATSPQRSKLRAKRSCGQCNVSAYQEHDSIGPELARTLQSAGVDLSPLTNNVSYRRSMRSVALSQNTDSRSTKKQRVNPGTSLFQPIQSPVGEHVQSLSPGKRKLQIERQTEEYDSTLPVKRALTRSSTKRKRLGYFDSSDSDNDSDQPGQNFPTRRVSPKKTKLSRSTKKQQRLDRRSSDSDSDQTRYRKTRRRFNNSESDNCQEPSREEQCISTSSHRGKRNLIEINGDTEGNIKIKRIKQRHSRDSHAGHDSDSSNSEFSDSEDGSDEETTVRKDPGQKHSPKTFNNVLNKFTAHPNGNSSYTAPLNGVVSRDQHRNLKMGEQGIRNAHGKILPRRCYVGPPNVDNSHAPPSQSSDSQNNGKQNLENNNHQASQSSPGFVDVSNIAKRLCPTSGAFMALKSSPAREKLIQASLSYKDGGDCRVQSDEDVCQRTGDTPNLTGDCGDSGDMKESSQKSISGVSESSGMPVPPHGSNTSVNEEPLSPFHDVVLTPPSKSSSPLKKEQQASKLGLKRHVDGSENVGRRSPVAMETDDGDDDPAPSSPNHRPVAKATRSSLGKSPAERFRNFWSTKKKSIGSNIKSFFSKAVGSPPLLSNATNSNLSLNESNSVNNTHREEVAPGRSATPFTFLSSDGRFGDPLGFESTAYSPTMSSSVFSLPSSPNSSHQRALNLVAIPQPFLSRLPASPDTDVATCVLRPSPPRPRCQESHSSTRTGGVTFSQSAPSLSSSPPGAEWRHRPLPLLSGRTTSDTQVRVSPRLRSRGCATSTQRAPQIVKSLPQASQFQVLHVQLAEQLVLSVSMGELTDTSLAGLVNSTDGWLTHTVTSCGRSVAARSGALLRSGCAGYLNSKGGPLETPDVLTTPAGGTFNSSVEAVLHVVAPNSGPRPKGVKKEASRGWSDHSGDVDETQRSLLLQVYSNCLMFAEEKLRLTSLAFPLIGAGDIPTQVSIQCFYDALLIFLQDRQQHQAANSPAHLSTVHLVIPDASTTDFIVDHLEACFAQLNTRGDLTSAVHEARGRYSHNQNEGDLTSAAATQERGHYSHSQNDESSIHNVTVTRSFSASPVTERGVGGGRALSGRPRVKRPRL